MPIIQPGTTTSLVYQRQCRALAVLLGLAVATASGHALAGPDGASADGKPTTAKDETHWSFRPIRLPTVPTLHRTDWVRNPIDAFIIDRLERAKLTPAGPAERLTLLRRATFDLTGLPPEPEEIQQFQADDRPDAYDRLVDRLLASKHYGERWGRHWLDVVRYADSSGFEADLLYPNAWRFRDYVIGSLNQDKPFDRFIQEQVAGDEIWPDDRDATTGSMLFCIGPVTPESASALGQLEQEWLTDAADTTGAAFLGLTFGCARCHNHKYDPIRQRDYYAMQAIFAASDRPFPEKVRINRIKALNGMQSDAPVPREVLDDPRCQVKTEKKAGYSLFHRDRPLEVRRLGRGELSKPAEVVEPGLPPALAGAGKAADLPSDDSSQRRARLARWLTSADNPLTSRVLVNRVWGWHFGRGIVSTPGDFGAQGEPPSHPKLLDWLAFDFVSHGWSLKRLHRLILTSNSYRMSSVAAGPGQNVDPDNVLLWQFPRCRLEGEVIRDAMLACSGRLNIRLGGPPVVPPLTKEELTGLLDPQDKWHPTKSAQEQARRSVYILSRRTFVYPAFSAFDPPEVMTSCARRMRTIVPAQALTLLNSPLARQQSAAFALRLLHECGQRPESIVKRAWLLAFGRGATAAETEHVLAFLAQRRAAAKSPGTAGFQAAVEEMCLALYNANEFVYID